RILDVGEQENPSIDLEILSYRKIPLKDGTIISANVYKPTRMAEPLPVIFAFTPYITDEAQKWGGYFPFRGYIYVHADVRGRGHSTGEFFPMERDGADGAEVVAWIAKQTWCNGQIVMRGGSYRGMVQWQIMKHFPPALKVVVPTASVMPGFDYPNPGGGFLSYMARWLGFTTGKTRNRNLFADDKYWSGK
ncbi:MAG: CocE/NonD family hydrolase, partial [bacterium]|nr:CocE/NonD family hydrolase [bacterium]